MLIYFLIYIYLFTHLHLIYIYAVENSQFINRSRAWSFSAARAYLLYIFLDIETLQLFYLILMCVEYNIKYNKIVRAESLKRNCFCDTRRSSISLCNFLIFTDSTRLLFLLLNGFGRNGAAIMIRAIDIAPAAQNKKIQEKKEETRRGPRSRAQHKLA